MDQPPQTPKLITACAWCKNEGTPTVRHLDQWTPLDEITNQLTQQVYLAILDRKLQPLYATTHGICPRHIAKSKKDEATTTPLYSQDPIKQYFKK